MKYLFTMLIMFFMILGCKRNKILNPEIKIDCTKVILQDTLDNPYVHFIVKFQNSNDYPVSIYTNPIYKKTDLKELKKAGIFLQIDNKPIYLGILHSNNYFVVQPKSELKLPFTYVGDLYKDKIKKDKFLTWKNELKKAFIGYSYNKEVMQQLYSEKKLKIDSLQTNNVSLSNIRLEETDFVFKKHFTIEDLINETKK